jgi:hypothetical protein
VAALDPDDRLAVEQHGRRPEEGRPVEDLRGPERLHEASLARARDQRE